jgi:hypothetical protein
MSPQRWPCPTKEDRPSAELEACFLRIAAVNPLATDGIYLAL